MVRRLPAKGFSLIELMVVISIILIMLSILAMSFLEARQNARDRQRLSDLKQIEFAVNVYHEIHGEYPTLKAFNVIEGDYIRVDADTFVDYWESSIVDPLDRGTPDSRYQYRIIPNLECNDHIYHAAVALNMEDAKNSNGGTVCSKQSGLENAFVVFIAGPLIEDPRGGFITGQDGGDWWEVDENQTWRDIYNTD